MQCEQINKNPDTFYIIQSFLSRLDLANLTTTSRSLHASVEEKNVLDAKLVPLMQRAGEINRSFGIYSRILADYTPAYLFSAEYTVIAKNIVLTAAVNAPLGHTIHETFGNFCGDTMSGVFSSILGIPAGVACGVFSHFAFNGGNNYFFHANVAAGAIIGSLCSGIAGSNNTAAVSEVTSSISPVTAVASTAAVILLAFGLYKNKSSVKEKRDERNTIQKALKKF